jgi:predicted MFS family arabinose efflux permease
MSLHTPRFCKTFAGFHRVRASSRSTASRSLFAVQWLNFFLADVQTGLGPFLAAYLAANGWNPGRVGFALTFGGLVTVVMQTPAGAVVDAVHRRRFLLAFNLGLLVAGALLLMHQLNFFTVYSAQLLIGGAAPFLGPTVAAITLGIVGAQAFDNQFGKNQAFNSAGNLFMAVLVGYLSYRLGYRTIFVITALMAMPALISLLAIDPKQIDYAQARGSTHDGEHPQTEGIFDLTKDCVLLYFLLAVFLFHLANAAMLPELGEMLSQNNPRAAGAFMSACMIVTQLVIAVSATWIGREASERGRRRLLLFGFAVLPMRGVLYTLTHSTTLLIGIQILDGVANAIFVVVSVLVIADRTQGTGRFNLASGALATTVGIGAALSNAIGGLPIQRFGFATSFLSLGGIALLAFIVLWFAVPETLPGYDRALSRMPAKSGEAVR